MASLAPTNPRRWGRWVAQSVPKAHNLLGLEDLGTLGGVTCREGDEGGVNWGCLAPEPTLAATAELGLSWARTLRVQMLRGRIKSRPGA
jgi:hypothetical protein